MSGYMHTNTTLDGVDGDKISVVRSHSGRNGQLTVEEVDEDDGARTVEFATVILSPLQMRALAALLLITAEEIERS